MQNRAIILALPLVWIMSACAPQPKPSVSSDGVLTTPPATSPTTPSTMSTTHLPVTRPIPGDATAEITSSFKLDMPFDTAAQLKLPPKVQGDFSLDLKSKSISTSPDRSTYAGDYRITLRDVAGARVLGTWSGTLQGEEDGTPAAVVDRVYQRFGNGAEILRRIVTPEQPRISQ